MKKRRFWPLWAVLFLFLVGCGYKGDLYLPEDADNDTATIQIDQDAEEDKKSEAAP
ncbi:MAG: hypothetical protein HQL54_07610 [Magnetococcales bacterium]|nr:hypothetical protein [Magnetococcales bacterium]